MAQPKYNNPITFDTLSYAKKLQTAGFTPEQAEVQAETFLAIVQEQLVSKRDLKDLEKEMKIEIENVRLEIANVKKELTIEIANVKKELTIEIKHLEVKTQNQMELLRRDLKIWFGGMLVVTISALSAMMTFIAHITR